MALNLDSAIDRIVENEIAALAALSTPVNADAKPYFYHWQESFPYWTNRVGPMQMGDLGEEFDNPTYSVIMRLVIDHMTADYAGNNEDKLKLWMPQVVTYFHAHPRLQTDSDKIGLNSIEEARIGNATGFRIFQNAGIPVLQIGCEFTLNISFYEQINLAYG